MKELISCAAILISNLKRAHSEAWNPAVCSVLYLHPFNYDPVCKRERNGAQTGKSEREIGGGRTQASGFVHFAHNEREDIRIWQS